ncbi:BTB domain-containing protein [Pseudoscourfieldia marina]
MATTTTTGSDDNNNNNKYDEKTKMAFDYLTKPDPSANLIVTLSHGECDAKQPVNIYLDARYVSMYSSVLHDAILLNQCDGGITTTRANMSNESGEEDQCNDTSSDWSNIYHSANSTTKVALPLATPTTRVTLPLDDIFSSAKMSTQEEDSWEDAFDAVLRTFQFMYDPKSRDVSIDELESLLIMARYLNYKDLTTVCEVSIQKAMDEILQRGTLFLLPDDQVNNLASLIVLADDFDLKHAWEDTLLSRIDKYSTYSPPDTSRSPKRHHSYSSRLLKKLMKNEHFEKHLSSHAKVQLLAAAL